MSKCTVAINQEGSSKQPLSDVDKYSKDWSKYTEGKEVGEFNDTPSELSLQYLSCSNERERDMFQRGCSYGEFLREQSNLS